MKISDVIKQQNITIEEFKETEKKSVSKRRYFWDEEPQPNLNQTEIIAKPQPQPNLNQTEIRKIETATKLKAEPKPQPQPNLNQTEITGLNSIVGLQRKILDIFFQYCVNNGSTNTGNIFVEEIAKKTETTSATVRTAIQRLEKKNCIIRSSYKNGRGGFSVYTIPAEVYQEWILNSKVKPNLNQTEVKLKAEPKPELKPDPLSKKESILNLKYNTVLLSQFPNVEKVGLKIEHIQKSERSEENLLELLIHFEHSLENNEIRSPQKLPIIISIINNLEKTWVSESYLAQLNKELEANLKRVEQLKNIKKQEAELKLRDKYNQFLNENQNFLNEVRDRQPVNLKNISIEILENLAFTEWKSQNEFTTKKMED